jgi:hypothetical protein
MELPITVTTISAITLGAVWLGLGSKLAESTYNILIRDRYETWLKKIKELHAQKKQRELYEWI